MSKFFLSLLIILIKVFPIEPVDPSMAIFFFPEIAAHLGEALWAQGREVEAKSVWTSALDQFPDNDVLLETVERYEMD